ncbi:MAG: Trm112 family protein [Thermoprotei archaeon]|nr:MAG: Trm112 family protein [Thermoprotei archaeon]
MKYRLLDLLACPMCKHFPLTLKVFKENRYEKREPPTDKRPVCELYCGFLAKYTKELGREDIKCEECFKREVDAGILICPRCKRWYPIEEEIPRMLPDELRDEEEDLSFLRKYKDKIPGKVLKEGKPFNLSKELK